MSTTVDFKDHPLSRRAALEHIQHQAENLVRFAKDYHFPMLWNIADTLLFHTLEQLEREPKDAA